MNRPDDAIVRRLDREHYRRGREERLFSLAAGAGRAGLPVAIGLIVDGVTMRGVLTTQATMASFLDKTFRASVTNLFPDSQEHYEDLYTMYSDAAERNSKRIDEDRSIVEPYLDDDGPADFDDIAADDVPGYVRALAPPNAVYLRQVQIYAGDSWVSVDTVEITTRQIAAWWPLEGEENTTVNYEASTGYDNESALQPGNSD